jgi:chromosome segregation ATPase
MIFTDKAAREKIASLESRISELEADAITKDSAIESHAADISAKDQTIAEHVASIASRDEQIAELTGKVSTAEAAASEKETKITELNAEVETAKQSASNIAIEKMAAIGQSEPLVIEGGEEKTEKTMTLAAFNQLPTVQKNQYIRKGGKLKD